MEIKTSPRAPGAVAELLRHGAGLKPALFLDFDGTLVEIAPSPGAAAPPLALPALLARLGARLGGALALVSGRRIADLDARLAPFRAAAAGVHGAEIRFAPTAEIESAPKLDSGIRAKILRLAQADPRLLVEDKGSALALHYRNAEFWGPELERRLEDYIRSVERTLTLQRGRKVVEIVGEAVSKGEAVRRLMTYAPFAGRIPFMIGDDLTDVSAFEACAAHGGAGFSVAGEFFAADEADFASPGAVRQWLADLAPERSR